SQMSRREVTVALSGEGADELFGGYVTYKADRYAEHLRRLPLRLRQWAGSAAGLLPGSDEKVGLDYKIARTLQGSVLEPEQAHQFWNGTFAPGSRRGMLSLAARGLLHSPD